MSGFRCFISPLLQWGIPQINATTSYRWMLPITFTSQAFCVIATDSSRVDENPSVIGVDKRNLSYAEFVHKAYNQIFAFAIGQ